MKNPDWLFNRNNYVKRIKSMKNNLEILTLIATTSQSSLSTRREGEEGESIIFFINIKMYY